MRTIYLGLVLALALGCGGKGKVGKGADEPAAKDGDESPPGDPNIARKERLDLEFTLLEDREGVTQLAISLVNETGSSSRIKVGTYDGTCTRIALNTSPGGSVAGELLAARCTEEGGRGRDLRFIVRQGQLVLLEARFSSATAERGYEQRGSFPLPSGATIEAEPLEGEKAETPKTPETP